jgi:hypothetical protein
MEKTKIFERYTKLAKDIPESRYHNRLKDVVEKLLNPNTELPKKSNIARIFFRDIPGTKTGWIQITSFENFKSGSEISEAYGENVRETYKKEQHRMYGKQNGKAIWLAKEKRLIEVGSRWPKAVFLDEIVPEARECGVVLSRLIKDSKKQEIQCIEI